MNPLKWVMLMMVVLYCVQARATNYISASDLKPELKDRIDVLYYGVPEVNTTAAIASQLTYLVKHPYFGALPDAVKLRLRNGDEVLSCISQLAFDLGALQAQFVFQRENPKEICGTVYYYEGKPYVISRILNGDSSRVSFVSNHFSSQDAFESDVSQGCVYRMEALDDIPAKIPSYFSRKFVWEPLLMVMFSLQLGGAAVLSLPNTVGNMLF